MLDALKSIGLSDGEIKVYAGLAQHGAQTIVQLARRAKLNRSYCYELLERLLAKGFAGKLLVQNKTYWQAMPREHVLSYFDEAKQNVDTALRSISRTPQEGARTITLFKGQRGVKAVCDAITRSTTKVLGFGAEGKIKKHLPYSYKHIFAAIAKNKTPFELIALKNKVPVVKDRFIKTKNFAKAFDTCVEINVYEDKTVLFFWKDDLEALVIQDRDVANSFRNYHKQFWEKL